VKFGGQRNFFQQIEVVIAGYAIGSQAEVDAFFLVLFQRGKA
jgi:hypothetical protein